ncbi:hypothetical protein CDAR_366751 [Caerostris darwini]|uniref:Uncharacterized protein n=1 Tax=Caerostris darwini TaxID=1538125 RepID=A0AAV4Q2B8_9ARAC|nr:hypothetical protein CDAR_366751 [Caerostris darwini]
MSSSPIISHQHQSYLIITNHTPSAPIIPNQHQSYPIIITSSLTNHTSSSHFHHNHTPSSPINPSSPVIHHHHLIFLNQSYLITTFSSQSYPIITIFSLSIIPHLHHNPHFLSIDCSWYLSPFLCT